jgi:GNAT superfamily N-acetyltransferase
MEKEIIRFRTEVRPGDVEAVREMVISTDFFYDFEVPVAVELVEERLAEGDKSGYHFLFAEIDGRTVAYSCYGHIMGTDACFDLFWIVTHNDYRGKGIGRILLEETQKMVKEMGGRMVIAETSTLDKYAPTRKFYLSMGYDQESVIRDFYKIGDGKVTFVKRV